MRKGDRVRVYQKPMTSEDFEGFATVTEVYPGDYDKGTRLHLCRVLFEDDESKETFIRRVSAVSMIQGDPLETADPNSLHHG